MKKFIIRDEDKNEFEVEELDKEAKTSDEDPTTENVLSDDEIKALKSLASVADKLVALVNKDVEDEDVDEDEEIDEKDEEEIIDTDIDEDKEYSTMKKDSKRSVGSIVKPKSKSIDDSEQLDIATAWAKRYGGNK